MEMRATVGDTDRITVALAGNPNSGKTSIFNQLTGGRQHVGNWPGVTVEKKEGYLNHGGQVINVVDLPGTYSLGAYSEDELVARDFLLSGQADVVINVADATNLERNLYLTTQLLEMGVRVVLALNMYDQVEKNRLKIDVDKLAQTLGIPVIKTSATRGQGINELIKRSVQEARKIGDSSPEINYGQEIETQLTRLEGLIQDTPLLTEIAAGSGARWLALKILEQDERLLEEMEKKLDRNSLKQIGKLIDELADRHGEETDTLIAEKRYGYIHGLVRESVNRSGSLEDRVTLSDKIDRVVTHRLLGIPIFLLVMWGMFKFTFALGDPLIVLIEDFFAWLGGAVGAWLLAVGASEFTSSLFVDGIIGGMGSVLVFIPNIFLLFLFISLLEDSGYMSRAAYVMDRVMQSFGLHGKSFIPLLIGFGCNVPGVMATRTLENRDDRMITILINNFMSCSARLPVYVVFAGVFFPNNEGNVIFSLYLLGIVLAIAMAKLFKSTLFQGDATSFVMELPPYRMPTIKGTVIHMWERGSSFLKKAGTIIFSVVVLIWFLANLPLGVEYAGFNSLIGRIGEFMSPIFAPLGLGSWQATASLIFGILAKEVIVGTLGVVYGAGEEGLRAVIMNNFTPLSAYTMMVVTLLYTPCVATLGAIKRETNSWKWTLFTAAYTFGLAWLVGFIIYQGGLLLGLG